MSRGEDPRAHLIGRDRRAAYAGDEGRWNSRIDRQAAAMHGNGAIDDICCAQDDRAPINRHEVCAQPRCAQISPRHKGPICGLDFVGSDQFVGREWRPADIVVAIAPIHPGGCPFIAWHPEPAETALKCPASVVVDHPAPVGLDIV